MECILTFWVFYRQDFSFYFLHSRSFISRKIHMLVYNNHNSVELVNGLCKAFINSTSVL